MQKQLLKKVLTDRIYDTRKYRYIVDDDYDARIVRIRLDLLDNRQTLGPETERMDALN